jgi:hypothetical protein
MCGVAKMRPLGPDAILPSIAIAMIIKAAQSAAAREKLNPGSYSFTVAKRRRRRRSCRNHSKRRKPLWRIQVQPRSR